jgi:hypothetical protein
MSDSFKLLFQGAISDSQTVLYTVTSTSTIIRHMFIVNTTGSTVSLAMWRNGLTDSYIIVPNLVLNNGESAEWEGVMSLLLGESIAATSSINNGLTITIDGDEITVT